MSWETELAKQLKTRNNVTNIGIVIGEVLSVEPLKIGIFNNQILLDKNNTYICSSLVNNYARKADVKINDYTAQLSAIDSGGDTTSSMNVYTKDNYDMEITYKDVLQVNGKVLIAASENNQTFFIIDKIQEVS